MAVPAITVQARFTNPTAEPMGGLEAARAAGVDFWAQTGPVATADSAAAVDIRGAAKALVVQADSGAEAAAAAAARWVQ